MLKMSARHIIENIAIVHLWIPNRIVNKNRTKKKKKTKNYFKSAFTFRQISRFRFQVTYVYSNRFGNVSIMFGLSDFSNKCILRMFYVSQTCFHHAYVNRNGNSLNHDNENSQFNFFHLMV